MGITDLHSAIAAVCPIDGVSIGSAADKTTWRIDFRPAATAAQKDAAKAIVAAFDVAAETAREDAQRLADQADALAAKADGPIATLKAMTPSQARAWVAANVNSLAEAKTLLGTMAAVLCVLARRL